MEHKIAEITVKQFYKIVLQNYLQNARQLPWRVTDENPVTPWGVLVSEFMLQQTQTDRVAGYWGAWLQRWPSPSALAQAPLEDVLRAWQGLGYNRRCRHLYDAAGVIAREFGDKVPSEKAALLNLPGIGDYTAGAIACFAWNLPEIFVETNIRAAVIHHFFPKSDKISDDEVKYVLKEALNLPEAAENPRKWYYALMDYGSVLKKFTPNPNRRSKTYNKQSPFEGSFRQKRAAVLRAYLAHEDPPPYARDELSAITASLRKDGLIE
jgi:A/G-specific adenine glycosylase